MDKKKVFISVGRTSTKKQEDFVCAVERMLTSGGLEPIAVGRNAFGTDDPLRQIERHMNDCAGTVVIAFERLHVEKGTERRGCSEAEDVNGRMLPTVWNQIELAMAHGRSHPLLVVVERGLRLEGLLEPTFGWYVQKMDIDPAALEAVEFQGVFADWRKKVNSYIVKEGDDGSATIEPGMLTVAQIFKAMTVAQCWASGTAIVTALAGVAALAYWLGTNVPPT